MDRVKKCISSSKSMLKEWLLVISAVSRTVFQKCFVFFSELQRRILTGLSFFKVDFCTLLLDDMHMCVCVFVCFFAIFS